MNGQYRSSISARETPLKSESHSVLPTSPAPGCEEGATSVLDEAGAGSRPPDGAAISECESAEWNVARGGKWREGVDFWVFAFRSCEVDFVSLRRLPT